MAKKHWSQESRNDRLQRQYAITEEQYEKIAQKQNGRCAICNCRQLYQRLAVDHDHKTGDNYKPIRYIRNLLTKAFNPILEYCTIAEDTIFEIT